MRRILVSDNVTLDGVMQAPARPDEDTREGFRYGGWAIPYVDRVMLESAGVGSGGKVAFLFGRRTYDDFATTWPNMPADNPFTKVLNESPKHVDESAPRELLDDPGDLERPTGGKHARRD